MLILTEKPSVAKDFAAALDAQRFGNYYKKDDIFITFCIGHLFELEEPHFYDQKFKSWKIEDLPIIPDRYFYRINTSDKERISHIKFVLKSLQEHKNDKIVIATDADREGELIARVVLAQAGITDFSNCYRFWVSEAFTKEVVLRGIKEAKPLSSYDKLASQGYARQHADWLVGMNFTRFFSVGNPEIFNVGRVQTSVLYEIARRNHEVKNFVATPYNELQATIIDNLGHSVKSTLLNPIDNKTAFDLNNSYLKQALSVCSNQPITFSEVVENAKTHKPEKLLNLNALQKKAFKLYGLQPEEVLKIAQSLYFNHKCLSYPRTPSRVMGDNNVELFLDKFNQLKSLYPEISGFSNINLIVQENKHIFNSAQLEAHHALIPLAPLPDNVTENEAKVYKIVIDSFFTVCMDDYKYNEKTIIFSVDNFKFKSIIKQTTQEGFHILEKSEHRPNVGAMTNKNKKISSAQRWGDGVERKKNE